MTSIKVMTQGELGAFVQSHLRNHGIEVVLSGGALVHGRGLEIICHSFFSWMKAVIII